MTAPIPRFRAAGSRATAAIALALGLGVAQPIEAQEEAPEAAALPSQLLPVYRGWRAAMIEGDRETWAALTARYRQVGMRNLIVSQKKPWPDAIFESPVAPPDVTGMTLARSAQNGVTGQLIYFGKADFGVEIDADEIPDGLLILMFIREAGTWKFNTSRFMSLAAPEAAHVAKQAAEGDFSFLDGDEFAPPGHVPRIPPLCPHPEIVGYVEIVSIGYSTRLKVADRSEHTVVDNIQQGVIIGGLKAGTNPISVDARELPLPPDAPDAKRHLEFTIFRAADDPGAPPEPIYVSGPKEAGRFRLSVRGNK